MSDRYRGGCAPGMPVEGACRRDCLHRALVEDYRAARAAWEALRESDAVVPAGAAYGGEGVAMHQLEDDEFRAWFPPPTFKTWLQRSARGYHS